MLTSFDHVNVKTANLDEMISWYDQILGLKSGRRPAFQFPGAWLYLGDQAVVHLVAQDTPLQTTDPQLEHVAFRASGKTEFLARLDAANVDYELAEVPGIGIVQVNIFDPDGEPSSY